MQGILLMVHLVATVVWVGGMFFAHMAMRPAAMMLEPAQRVQFIAKALGNFFPYVWGVVLAIPVSGYWLIFGYLGGMAGVRMHVHIMQGIGLLMIFVFVYIYLLPYQALQKALAAQDVPLAARQIARIKHLILVNLTMGMIEVILGSWGRFFF